MTVHCHYHVLEPAEWRCANCSIDFCATCAPEPADEDAAQPRKCAHCKATLQPLGAAYNAPPFWQRLTAFLRYPLSPLGMAFMVAAFLVPLLVPAGALLHAARLGFLLPLTLYLWALFEQVAAGNLQPLGLRQLARHAGKTPLPLYLGLMLAVLAGVAGFVSSRNAFTGSLLVGLLLGLLPALLMGVGINRSVSSGFSKDSLLGVLRGVGPVYAAVFLLPVLLLAALVSFVSLFADVLPEAVGQGLYMAAYTYAAIAVFALSAYVLFQYQEPLEYVPEGGATRRKPLKRVDPLQLQLEMHLKDGNYGKAVTLLKADVEKKAAALAQHERYHRLIWALRQEADLRAHAVPYFKALLQAGRGVQATREFREHLQRYPDFKLEDPDLRIELATAFEQQGDCKLAVHVLNGMHKDYPNFSGLPDAYLLAARLLAGPLGLPQKALALVQFLHGRFRNHRRFPDIARLQAELSRQLGGAVGKDD